MVAASLKVPTGVSWRCYTYTYAASVGVATEVGQGSLGHNILTLIADRTCLCVSKIRDIRESTIRPVGGQVRRG